MFFPKEGSNIEEKFLIPALFNAKNVHKLVTSPNVKAFNCNLPLDVLKENYKGAYDWIVKFSTNFRKRKGVLVPLPTVLKRAKKEWYDLVPKEYVEFFTMMNPDTRFFFGRFEQPEFINQRLVGLNLIKKSTDAVLCHALLNSILVKFFIEAVGFGRGLGVLDINKELISKCKMLNPSLLSEESIQSIKKTFNVILQKDIIPIEKELVDEDWVRFNMTILNAYGIGHQYNNICSSFLSLHKTRAAVKIMDDSLQGPMLSNVEEDSDVRNLIYKRLVYEHSISDAVIISEVQTLFGTKYSGMSPNDWRHLIEAYTPMVRDALNRRKVEDYPIAAEPDVKP